MIRRQIFFGLTLVLLAVVIFLLLRGRKAEKAREAQSVEIETKAQEAPPSPTRVLVPRELELVEAGVSFTPSPEGKDTATARHDMTIRNTGGVAYGSLRLRLEYLDRKGKALESRTHTVDKPLPPGESLRLVDIALDGLPMAAADCRVTVLSADLAAIAP